MEEKTRILILDDNVSDAELMRRDLTKSGLSFTSELAQDKQAFIQALSRFTPDIILADYSLPAFDGMSALRLARERFEDIPVIIVSGAVGEETAIEAVKGGATDYVLKQRLKRLGPVVHRALLETAVLKMQKQAEEALLDSRNLLQNIIDNTTSLVYVFDLEGRFIVANKRLAGLVNSSPQMMLGKKRQDFIPKDAADQHEANDRKVIKAGKPMEFEEYGSFDGRLITFLTTKFPLYKNGNLYAVAGISTDISDRKATEATLKHDKDTFEKMVQERSDELIEAQLELEKIRRLSDIGILAATVAHELRNPLAAIKVAVHNIRRKIKTAELDKHLDTIGKKISESDQIINNLLFYSRLKLPHFEPVRMSEIIEEGLEIMGSPGGKEVSVTKDMESVKDIIVEADPLQIREVIINVLNNAYDAVQPKDGRISIKAENLEGSIKVVIKDNGTGINREVLDRIFDPFFTTKSKGTGLGLSICKQIVNMHGGKISVESEPGKGTEFSIHLPKKKGHTSNGY